MICMVILSETNSYLSNQSNTITMFHTLFRSLWTNATLFLFWLFGNVHLRRISLTSLPNELLLSIIERIPVNDLICTLPRISSQFDKITKLTCNRRRALNVICGDSKCLIPLKPNSPVYTLKFDTISQLNEENVKKIISIFPNVRSLQLIASGVTVSQLNESIIDILLSRLYDQLEALHLELTFEFQVFSRANAERTYEDNIQMQNGSMKGIERVSKLINRMNLLRRLTVCNIFQLPQLYPSILAQLNEFYVFSNSISNHHFESLLEHGAQLKRIGIGNLGENIPLSIRTRKTRVFLSKITHFGLFIDQQLVDPKRSYPIDNFRDLLLCMSNLCELSIIWLANRPLDELIRALQPITRDVRSSNLVTLKLTIVHDHPVYDETPLDLSSLVDSIQLRSIKQLQLLFCAHSHQTYQLLHLESIFPNLRTIHYDNIVSHCSICGFEHSDYFDENWWYRMRRTKCINLIVKGVLQMRPKPEIVFTYKSRSQYKTVDLNFTVG